MPGLRRSSRKLIGEQIVKRKSDLPQETAPGEVQELEDGQCRREGLIDDLTVAMMDTERIVDTPCKP